MISIFIHLLALTYITVSFAGELSFFPVTFMVLWMFMTLVGITYWLPQYTDKLIAKNKFEFIETQSKYQWIIVIWILLLQTVSDPVKLVFPNYAEYFPQILPLLVSTMLYIFLAKPVFYEFYRLFKPILDEKQTANDFLRARLTVPILFFPPVMLWVLIEDIGSVSLQPLNDIRLMAVAPLFFILLYILSPKLFNWAWKAEPNNDENLENMLKEVSKKADTPVSGVKIWNTFNEPIPNAAVAGLSNKYRFVYITRYLLDIFSPAQVRCVVAHELGHIRLGHISTYLFYSLTLIMASIALKSSILIYFPQYYSESQWYAIIEMLIFIVIFAISFTALARYGEYQADAFATNITSPKDFASGLEKLSSIILSPPSIVPEWLMTHPPLSARIEKVNSSQISAINDLLKQAKKIRLVFMICMIALAFALIPSAKIILEISDIHKAAQAGNDKLALKLHRSLPEWLKLHPIIMKEAGQIAVKHGQWLHAIAIAAHQQFDISLIPESEIFHHSSTPEIAFDFKVMKFILKTLDLR